LFAVFAEHVDQDDPLSGLRVGDRPAPERPSGWTRVRVEAASLNHRDIWLLRGAGLPPERLPMILGCDATGYDEDGEPVIVHAVIADPDTVGDETFDPKRTLLSELHQGTFAEEVVVPRRNVLRRPSSLSAIDAACLSTSWLTAYRMLFTRSGLRAGDTVLIQGAGGGLATALIALARTAGFRVWVTSRDKNRGERALELGAHEVFASGERLPRRVDAVMDSVGEATWSHSVRSLRPGGTLVTSGVTTGDTLRNVDLNRIFLLQLRVVGSTMGTRAELRALIDLLDATDVRPVIDSILPITDAPKGFRRMLDGEVFGKVVFTVPGQ
jgi:NADPH:quinone reductase-like Zn-dependent oxidoreductase